MEKSSSSSLRPSSSRLPPLQTPPFSLPADWSVDEVPRSDGSKSDKYYIEPGSGRRFRSLREVERHLNGETVSRACRRKSSTELLIASNRPTRMPTLSREEWSVRPPSKVNWTLASPQGDAWNPSIGDTLISDAEKQEWSKRFALAMNNNNKGSAVMPTQQPPQAAEENIEQQTHQSPEGGRQEEEEEGGLRRSSRSKKLAYNQHDFVYI